MKKDLSKYLRPLLATLVCVSLWACTSDPNSGPSSLSSDPEPDPNQARMDAIAALTGNGAPNGAHYNLNIIGVSKDKSADMTGDNGRRIFVNLEGKTQILLTQGDFSVLDANGTDGKAAFQLPNPDPDNDGVTAYSVFARALGKPGGSSTITVCASDTSATLDTTYCSVFSTVFVRNKGASKFTDISKSLLYIYADLNGDGVLERYPLFDAALQDYFWAYDNNGLKLVQLRFYEVPSNVN